jgi:hypothetical protein
LLIVEKVGIMNRCGDVQETQVLDGFTIELLFFLAKAREKLDFLLKHRDLDCQAEEFPFRNF